MEAADEDHDENNNLDNDENQDNNPGNLHFLFISFYPFFL